MANYAEEINCGTLKEFWTAISPIGPGREHRGRIFIYRGQPDSTWKLVPRVFRSSEIEKYKRGMMRALHDHPGQVFFEFFLLRAFLRYCDSSGLAVPEDSMEFRNYFTVENIMQPHGVNHDTWPQDGVLSLMALAQSHGIPTRLLDWSDNPFVAAYFAAAQVIWSGSETRDGRLAVFALNISQIDSRYDLRLVRVPGSVFPNLAVQRSSFVLVGNSGYRGDEFSPDVSLESRLVQNDKTPKQTILFKVTLPRTLAPDLHYRCSQFGISAASVFPGYDGSAQAVLEETLATPN